jgi:hypothetical protein
MLGAMTPSRLRLVPVALLVLVPSAAWPCTPAPFTPYELKGTGPRKLVLAVGRDSAVLRDARGQVWKLPLHSRKALLAPDESWVAFDAELGRPTVTLVGTERGAKPFHVDVIKPLSVEERSRIGVLPCGLAWNAGIVATNAGLQVEIAQQALPRVVLLVRPDGTITRNPAPDSLAPPEPPREETGRCRVDADCVVTSRASLGCCAPCSRPQAMSKAKAEEIARLCGLHQGGETCPREVRGEKCPDVAAVPENARAVCVDGACKSRVQ